MSSVLMAAALTMAALLVHRSRRRPRGARARSEPSWPGAGRVAALWEGVHSKRRDPFRVWAGAADVLAAELDAGAAPGAGLVRALESGTTTMQRAGRSIALGADADAVLETLSQRPGHEGATALRACWSITVSVGGGAAHTVRRVADALRDEADVRAEIRAQLAAPRATARMVAGLPLAGPLLGALMGVDTVHVLATTLGGRTLLVTGLALDLLGLLWVRRLVSSAERAA